MRRRHDRSPRLRRKLDIQEAVVAQRRSGHVTKLRNPFVPLGTGFLIYKIEILDCRHNAVGRSEEERLEQRGAVQIWVVRSQLRNIAQIRNDPFRLFIWDAEYGPPGFAK